MRHEFSISFFSAVMVPCGGGGGGIEQAQMALECRSAASSSLQDMFASTQHKPRVGHESTQNKQGPHRPPPAPAWSSSDSLSAACTLAAPLTISALSSRHFLISRFSLSCDLRSARKTCGRRSAGAD